MHELKVARSQALTTREMAQIGLFTALIAAGPILRSIYRCSPFPCILPCSFYLSC